MTGFRYLSLFSGIGGLEHPSLPPVMFCEQDPACQAVLRRRYDGIEVGGDISVLDPPSAEVVAGGWPCQDLSAAGTRGGIAAARSGLFFQMLRVAKLSGAHTLVGENVPNLLTINLGRDFQTVLDALVDEGFPFVAWRILNAREFGLPQERRRLFIVASKVPERALALHAAVPFLPALGEPLSAAGFYWTGGKRSICFSPGYVPALKIGATDNRGRAPVAVYWRDRVRKLTPREFLRLQGFGDLPTDGLAPSTVLRMAGNAVPPPMGHFVLSAVSHVLGPSGMRTAFGVMSPSGILDDGMTWAIQHSQPPLATNLADFIDLTSAESLSPQAAAGLIVRSVRSGQPMPLELFELLLRLAADREWKLRASRANSFEALDRMAQAVDAYRESLTPMSEFTPIDYEDDDEFELQESDDADDE